MTNDIVRPLKTNRVSLSVQAQQYLHSLIEGGTYGPGDQLPSETELAAQLGISRPTLREALLNLEQEGLVLRRHGVGTFVAPGYEHRLESGLERLESILELAGRQGMQLQFDRLQVREKPADPEIAEKLQVPVGTPVTHVLRVIRVKQQPVAYMHDVTPASTFSPNDIDETFNGSVLDLLRRNLDLRVAHAVADIVACNADDSLARKLGIKAGRAILLLEEILFDDEGMVLEFSRNYFVPDFFRFHVVRH
jgi:GntR family transcriptional regulator